MAVCGTRSSADPSDVPVKIYRPRGNNGQHYEEREGGERGRGGVAANERLMW